MPRHRPFLPISNASGRSPHKATRAFFAAKGLTELPEKGPLSWSVPGCVDGWEELRKRFGKLSLEQILTPSIRYAEDGFPVTEVIGGYWVGAEELLKQHGDTAKTYLIDRKAPRPGQVFRNPNLAKSYRAIAQHGRDAFYKGRLAETMVRFSDKHGGRRGMVAALCMLPILAAFVAMLYTPAGYYRLAIALLAVIGFFIYPVINLITIAALDIVSKKAIGAAAGFIGLWGYVGRSAMELGFGRIVDVYSVSHGKVYAWNVVIALTLAAGVIATVLLSFTWKMRPRA